MACSRAKFILLMNIHNIIQYVHKADIGVMYPEKGSLKSNREKEFEFDAG